MCTCFSGLPSFLDLRPANGFRNNPCTLQEFSFRAPNHEVIRRWRSCSSQSTLRMVSSFPDASRTQARRESNGSVASALPLAKNISRRPFWRTRTFYSFVSIVAALGAIFSFTQQAALAAAAASVNGAANAARPAALTAVQDSTVGQILRAMWSKFLLKWQLYSTIPIIAGLLNWATNNLAVKVQSEVIATIFVDCTHMFAILYVNNRPAILFRSSLSSLSLHPLLPLLPLPSCADSLPIFLNVIHPLSASLALFSPL